MTAATLDQVAVEQAADRALALGKPVDVPGTDLMVVPDRAIGVLELVTGRNAHSWTMHRPDGRWCALYRVTGNRTARRRVRGRR